MTSNNNQLPSPEEVKAKLDAMDLGKNPELVAFLAKQRRQARIARACVIVVAILATAFALMVVAL